MRISQREKPQIVGTAASSPRECTQCSRNLHFLHPPACRKCTTDLRRELCFDNSQCLCLKLGLTLKMKIFNLSPVFSACFSQLAMSNKPGCRGCPCEQHRTESRGHFTAALMETCFNFGCPITASKRL